MRLVQVALSCSDMVQTRRWYAECFGYLPAGGFDSDDYPGSVDLSEMQGLENVSFDVGWIVDQQELFQLELFQYRNPQARPLPPEWRPCDIGYTTLGLWVKDFDATMARLAKRGSRPLTEPLEIDGARRVCVRDPGGVLLEIMEDDVRRPGGGLRPRPELPTATRMVRASVPDLARSTAYFVERLGLRRHEPVLHTPEHESLWKLEGAKRRVQLLSAGDLWLELVQYEQPRPAPWPDDYRISDLGILNVAFGTRRKETYLAVSHAVRSGGYRLNRENDVGFAAGRYTVDDQGFSVELLYVDPTADARIGFLPMDRARDGRAPEIDARRRS